MPIPRFLAPDHDRYDGVRPIQIYMLRALYFLMAAFVATEAWRVILTHQGAVGSRPRRRLVRVGDGYVLRHYVLPARARVA